MSSVTDRRFATGVAAGVVGSLLGGVLVLYLLNVLGLVAVSVNGMPEVQVILAWTYRNLGLSVVPFGITLMLFLHSLRLLGKRLDCGASIDRVAQTEHLADIWISLFFGIGVIWTAIGMRGALLQALGAPGSLAADGAFAVLQRLVDGGILTALSTTILGGIGGYLMRVVKAVTVGPRLKRFYGDWEHRQGTQIQAILERIESAVSRPQAERQKG
jgi:hypothetical protein